MDPVAPVLPIGPCGPVLPVLPCGPFGPVDPAGPALPVAPFAPVAPKGPIGPCGSRWSCWSGRSGNFNLHLRLVGPKLGREFRQLHRGPDRRYRVAGIAVLGHSGFTAWVGIFFLTSPGNRKELAQHISPKLTAVRYRHHDSNVWRNISVTIRPNKLSEHGPETGLMRSAGIDL